MDLESLKQIIKGKPIGDFYPYNLEEFDIDQIDDYIKSFVNGLRNIPNVELNADYNSYGSGFASYVDVFIYLRDGSTTKEYKGYVEIEGLQLYICRLIPFAVYGKGYVTKNLESEGSSHGFLRTSGLEVIPKGEWTQILIELNNKLNEFQFQVPAKVFLDKKLPFDAVIPTILEEDYYRIYDAIFYWED